MGHDHSHEDLKTYYVEQLCTIGIAGALGGIAVMLYERNLLWFIAPKVQPWVLGGGLALLVLVVLRAAVVWVQAGRKRVADHEHEHDHEHSHDHAHGADCGHDHDHDHAHSHDHAHGDTNPDSHGHDHGAAPWRYVILLLPVALYFLGLPNEHMARADVRDAQKLKLTDDSLRSLKADLPESVLAKLDPLKEKSFKTQQALESELATLLQKDELDRYQSKIVDSAFMQGWKPKEIAAQSQDRPLGVSFTELQRAPSSQDTREFYEGKTVQVKGEYLPGNDRMFTLVRYKMNCCARDAVALSAMILIDPKSESTLRNYQSALRGKWVEVTGQCQFQQKPDQPNTWTTLIVLRPDAGQPLFDANGKDERALIKVTQPDASYYLY